MNVVFNSLFLNSLNTVTNQSLDVSYSAYNFHSNEYSDLKALLEE